MYELTPHNTRNKVELLERCTTHKFDATVFLAGSIANGDAVEWQKEIVEEIKAMEKEAVSNITAPTRFFNTGVFNPRNHNWDKSIVPNDYNNLVLQKQIDWELDAISLADYVIFYFDAKTQSPITLQELGYATGLGKQLVVYCPKEFWRYANVRKMVDRNSQAKMADSFAQLKYMTFRMLIQ